MVLTFLEGWSAEGEEWGNTRVYTSTVLFAYARRQQPACGCGAQLQLQTYKGMMHWHAPSTWM